MPLSHISHLAALSLQVAEPGSLGGTEGPDMTRYLLVCSGLLLGIVALAWGARRLVGRRVSAKAAQRSLQIMDVLPMGGRHRLAVVRCYDRTFLLGLGDKELSVVAELDPVIAPETEPLPSEADRRAFASLLERVVEKPEVERVLAPRRATPERSPRPARAERPTPARAERSTPARPERSTTEWLG